MLLHVVSLLGFLSNIVESLPYNIMHIEATVVVNCCNLNKTELK